MCDNTEGITIFHLHADMYISIEVNLCLMTAHPNACSAFDNINHKQVFCITVKKFLEKDHVYGFKYMTDIPLRT